MTDTTMMDTITAVVDAHSDAAWAAGRFALRAIQSQDEGDLAGALEWSNKMAEASARRSAAHDALQSAFASLSAESTVLRREVGAYLELVPLDDQWYYVRFHVKRAPDSESFALAKVCKLMEEDELRASWGIEATKNG